MGNEERKTFSGLTQEERQVLDGVVLATTVVVQRLLGQVIGDHLHHPVMGLALVKLGAHEMAEHGGQDWRDKAVEELRESFAEAARAAAAREEN